MKTKTAVAALGLCVFLTSMSAVAGKRFYDKAKVVSATPIYETVQVSYPEEQCWKERVRHQGWGHEGSYTPVIAGAIVGGVVGNQFGGGRGRDALTVAGALLGASVGNDLATRGRRGGYVRVERRCETVERYEEEEVLAGYRVKYRYHGKVFTTRTDTHPGKRIKVRVGVEPAPKYAYKGKGHRKHSNIDTHPGKWKKVRVDVEPVPKYAYKPYRKLSKWDD